MTTDTKPLAPVVCLPEGVKEALKTHQLVISCYGMGTRFCAGCGSESANGNTPEAALIALDALLSKPKEQDGN